MIAAGEDPLMPSGLPPTHEDIYRRLASGQERFAAMDEKLDLIIRSQETMQQAHAEMKDQLKDVKETADATKDLVEAWGAVKGAGKVASWVGKRVIGLAALITALGIAVAAIKAAAIHIIRG